MSGTMGATSTPASAVEPAPEASPWPDMFARADTARRFNISTETDIEMPASWLETLDQQLAIIERAALHPDILAVMRRVPLLVQPLSAFGARYRTGCGVEIGSLELPADRPIVLHEMMHALHYANLPGGFENKAIASFYNRALTYKIYPASSYLLRSCEEFFAITATVIAHGEIKRPPYTRENLRRKQPHYHRWLTELLQNPVATAGPREGITA